MSKYLSLIKADLRAVDAFVNGNDEFDLNIAAYHCQQAVEKTCGYAAQLKGLKAIRSHNVTAWVEYLHDNHIFVPEKIIVNSDEISGWESGSRYNINFVVVRTKVLQVKAAVDDWLTNFENNNTVNKKTDISE
jgi:hypothetical protein